MGRITGNDRDNYEDNGKMRIMPTVVMIRIINIDHIGNGDNDNDNCDDDNDKNDDDSSSDDDDACDDDCNCDSIY